MSDFKNALPADNAPDANLLCLGSYVVEKAARLGWIKAPPNLLSPEERRFAERIDAREYTDVEILAACRWVLAGLESLGYDVGDSAFNLSKFYNDLRGS